MKCICEVLFDIKALSCFNFSSLLPCVVLFNQELIGRFQICLWVDIKTRATLNSRYSQEVRFLVLPHKSEVMTL